MKFAVEVGSLRDAVSNAKQTTDTGLVVLQGLFLKTVTKNEKNYLEIYSAKNTARSLFTIPANVTTHGSIVVRPDQVLAGLKGQENDTAVFFNFSDKLNRLCAICDGSKFKIAVAEGKDHLEGSRANLPETIEGGSLFNPNILRGVVKRAAWCANAHEGSNVPVDALSFKPIPEGYRVLATDGYIAVRVDVNTEAETEPMIVQRGALETLTKFMGHGIESTVLIKPGAEVNGVKRETFFRGDGFTFAVSNMANKFPEVDVTFTRPEFLPTRIVLVSREALSARLNRISGFVEKGSPSVKLTLQGSILKLSTASENGDCIEPIEVEYSEKSKFKESDKVTWLAVSSVFLTKAISSLESEYIALGFRNESSPLVIIDEPGEDIHTRYLIMTCRPSLDAVEEESEETEEFETVTEAAAEGDSKEDDLDLDLDESDDSDESKESKEDEEDEDDGQESDEISLD